MDRKIKTDRETNTQANFCYQIMVGTDIIVNQPTKFELCILMCPALYICLSVCFSHAHLCMYTLIHTYTHTHSKQLTQTGKHTAIEKAVLASVEHGFC